MPKRLVDAKLPWFVSADIGTKLTRVAGRVAHRSFNPRSCAAWSAFKLEGTETGGVPYVRG